MPKYSFADLKMYGQPQSALEQDASAEFNLPRRPRRADDAKVG
jgi:hypothetical protein